MKENKQKKEKLIMVAIRVTKEEKEKIEEYAKKDRRSVNQYIISKALKET